MAKLIKALARAWRAMSVQTRKALAIWGVVGLLFVGAQVAIQIADRRTVETQEAQRTALQEAAAKRKEVEAARRAALTNAQREAEDKERARAAADEKARIDALNADLAAMKAEEEKRKTLASARFQQAAAATRAIKAVTREPESVRWDSVLVNEEGTIACIEYGARNGFGGMNREFMVFTANRARADAATWNKHCANKRLYDMRAAAP